MINYFRNWKEDLLMVQKLTACQQSMFELNKKNLTKDRLFSQLQDTQQVGDRDYSGHTDDPGIKSSQTSSKIWWSI